jgi:hypothetical protein
MQRKTQGATLNIALLAALGVLVTITRDGKETPLLEGNEDGHNLRPGDTVQITVAANEQWEAAQARNAEAARLAAEQTDDVDHRQAKAAAAAAGAAADARAFGAEAGGPLPGADQELPKADANAGQGTVTADKGATRERSTGKAAT